MLKSISYTLLGLSAACFLSSAAAAQNTHAGHDHSANDGHNHGSAMSEAERAKIDYVFTQSPEDHVMGEADAPNIMILYASVTCPHCSDWFIHHEFVTAPQEVAVAGFQLGLCAPSEDYFDILTYQMEGQETTFQALKDGRAIERFLEIAKEAGIETQEDMFACFDKKEGFERLERQIDRARAGNIKGVPGVILNGKLIDSDVDADSLKALLP